MCVCCCVTDSILLQRNHLHVSSFIDCLFVSCCNCGRRSESVYLFTPPERLHVGHTTVMLRLFLLKHDDFISFLHCGAAVQPGKECLKPVESENDSPFTPVLILLDLLLFAPAHLNLKKTFFVVFFECMFTERSQNSPRIN